MTITVAPARNEYTANAGQTVFNYTFKIYESTDLNVYVTPSGQSANDSLNLTTAYTVAGVGSSSGGTVTLISPANLDDKITIVSNIPESRTTDYQNNGDFRPETVNNDIDRTVSLIKQADDESGRTLKFEQSAQNSDSLSLPTPEPGRLMVWKDDLSGLKNQSVSELSPDLISSGEIKRSFDTLAGAAASADISSGDAVQVDEYSLGNGGGGTWDIVASGTFPVSSYVVNHATLPLQLVLRVSNYMDIRAFGATEAAVDNSAIMTDAFNHPAVVTLTGEKGVAYNYTSNVSATRDAIKFDSVHFHGVNAEVVLSGTLTELGQLTVGGLKGTRDISFGTSAGIVRGDLLIIHDQWNEDAATFPPLGRGSFSQHRQAYMDGEFNRVAKINSAILTMTDMLDGVGDYPVAATTKILKMEGIAVELKDSKFTTFTNTGANAYSLTINYGVNVRINDSDVEARGSLIGALLLNKCHDVIINSGRYFNDTLASGLNYGISIANCDTVAINGVDAYGTRHAVTTGGDLLAGAVPNNKITINGSRLGNDGSVYCADFHGNTKNSYYIDNQVSNDIGLGGQDVGAINNKVVGGRANPTIELQEIVGGKIKIHNNNISLSPASTTNEIIGWGSSLLAQQVDRPFHIEEVGNEYEINSSITRIVTQLIQQSGDAQSTWTSEGCIVTGDDSSFVNYYSASISNPAAHAAAPVPPRITSLTRLGYPASNTFKFWDDASGVFTGMVLTLPTVTSPPVELTVQAGGWNSTLGGIGGQLVFNYPDYPIKPFVTASHQGWAKGNVPQFFANVGTLTESQCQVYISTADSTITTVVDRVITAQAVVSFENVTL